MYVVTLLYDTALDVMRDFEAVFHFQSYAERRQCRSAGGERMVLAGLTCC